MALTLDIWSIPPESARRVGHPAPFPVELPEQLIRLLTFKDDLVLDPFMGSGSALVQPRRGSVGDTSATTSTTATWRSPASGTWRSSTGTPQFTLEPAALIDGSLGDFRRRDR